MTKGSNRDSGRRRVVEKPYGEKLDAKPSARRPSRPTPPPKPPKGKE